MVLSSFQLWQTYRTLVFLLCQLLDFGHSSAQSKSLVARLTFWNNLSSNWNVIDLMLGDYIELVCEFSKNLWCSLESDSYFPAHSHSNLNRRKSTGPISLMVALTNMLLGLLIVTLCEMTSSFLISIFSS